ncbi:zinc finger protein 718-like isoform X1 [Photinus pyralis]|uniref:zinc finger protein 718-like isoform X1 n=1 Tax=Photinus pyralis TaxID=7054 RepID=UPI0012673CB8|nr:zinc finger protein 718-like isoform X1 [Photinus pyralis]
MNNLTETSGNEETEKQYACKFCSKKYKLPTRLHAHEKLCLSPASQEKSCKTCGQSFKQPKRLQKHELMHTLDHKFSCKFCSWHFSTKHELNVHKADEHSDKVQRRRCKLCPNSVFNTKEEYFVHVNEEHKGQSSDYHMCSDCGKQFKTKSELNNHNKSLCGTVKQFKCENRPIQLKWASPKWYFNGLCPH